MAGLKKKFSFQLVYAFSQAVFPLITYPYLTRTIGAEGLGMVGYVDYVTGLIITLAAFGIPFYGVREVAKTQAEPRQRAKLFQQLFSIHLVASLLGAAIFLLILKANPQQHLPTFLIALGCVNILLPPFMAEWYMQGIEAFQFTTIRSIVLRFFGLAAILLFIRSRQDFVLYFFIVVLVQLAVALTNLVKIGYKNLTVKKRGWQIHLRPLWHFFLSASIISVYVFFDVIILGWFAKEKDIGYYTLAIRIVKLSLLLILSLNVILFPRIANLLLANDHRRIQLLLQKAFSFLVLVTLPISAGFYFLAPAIILLLGGDGFTPSIHLLRILSLLPLVIGLSNLFVYQVLVPFGREKKLLLSVFITCMCSLLFHVVLASLFKATGTAVATLLTETCMTLLSGFFAFKTTAIFFQAKLVWQAALAVVPLVFFSFFFRYFFGNPFAVLVCSGLLGIGLYGVIQLFLFKNEFLKEALHSIRWRKKLSISNG